MVSFTLNFESDFDPDFESYFEPDFESNFESDFESISMIFLLVDILTASDLDTFFGTTESSIGRGNTESGYILFYQKVDEEKEKEQNETTNHVSNSKSQKEKKNK